MDKVSVRDEKTSEGVICWVSERSMEKVGERGSGIEREGGRGGHS